MEMGSSLAVENVQELASSKPEDIPNRYIRAEREVEEMEIDGTLHIPVIDMSRLPSCPNEMEKLHQACQGWGFFQLINHGSAEVIEQIKVVTSEFFKQPLEMKMAYAMQPDSLEGYGQHFIMSNDQKLDWCDMLFLHVLPVHIRNMAIWPSMPSFRSTIEQYSLELNEISISLVRLMAENLGVPSDRLGSMFRDGGQLIRINYYPPCLQADKVIGLTPHSDASGLTLLVQANDVEGLQIRKNGRWVPVKPVSGAIIVNIGDVIEMISNGEYKSVEHRAVVNVQKERLSIAAFHGPNINSRIGPQEELVGNGANYRTIEFKEFLKMHFDSKLDGKNLLSRVKTNHSGR